jgi:hypothetical protein
MRFEVGNDRELAGTPPLSRQARQSSRSRISAETAPNRKVLVEPLGSTKRPRFQRCEPRPPAGLSETMRSLTLRLQVVGRRKL